MWKAQAIAKTHKAHANEYLFFSDHEKIYFLRVDRRFSNTECLLNKQIN